MVLAKERHCQGGLSKAQSPRFYFSRFIVRGNRAFDKSWFRQSLGRGRFGQVLVSIVTTMLSFAGLWGEIYLLTGILLDSGKHIAPSGDTIFKNVSTGMKKGLAYSGILMTLLYAMAIVFMTHTAQQVMMSFPYLIGILAGILVFPLVKTIIESFDGSLPFFDRLAFSYRNPVLYARGAVVGFGFAAMIVRDISTRPCPTGLRSVSSSDFNCLWRSQPFPGHCLHDAWLRKDPDLASLSGGFASWRVPRQCGGVLS